jgi:urea transport system ATP-binding protein
MTPLLEVAGLETHLGGSRILRGVDLTVRPGEIVALMGRNGVGKSTTLRSITGVVPTHRGSIRLAGQELGPLPPDARARAGIGYVPQGRDIFPHLTVEENLRLGLVVQGRRGSAAREALDRVFTLFPVLREMLPRKGGVLSGGQQQQLAIGRALLTHPRLLILDEPTEGIQPSIIEHIGDTLKRLRQEGLEPDASHEIRHALQVLRAEGRLAILLVEQFVDFCRECADRFYAMDRGAVVASGTVAELTDDVVRRHLQV